MLSTSDSPLADLNADSGVADRARAGARALLPLHGASVTSAHNSDFQRARKIVEQLGQDSLSPFILRPDKAFHFAAGGVLGYRVFGRTAVISSDPVAPAGAAARVLGSFIERAKQQRWQVVLWAASGRHLTTYRRLGFRAICAGEEAVVDPAQFTLEGRAVRKLRQSVHRVERRGWEITERAGGELTGALRREVALFEDEWRESQAALLGFAMGFGPFTSDARADDLYLLGRSPEGRLGAVMHFIAHCGRLSLDTMHRVGETPNGLNEALVSRALRVARERSVAEVSLNYAGLGHLIRSQYDGGPLRQIATGALLNAVGPGFQMERLVHFNEKFSPEWRPRFLLYKSRFGLARAIVRVLQAEGHLRHFGDVRPTGKSPSIAPALPDRAFANAIG